ncbi:MAG: hypothetical protein E5V33_05695 [Mesorhizobium sp.]|nr:MAG: hypothetical protein E5V33_05695 [Mesorhizobium sp.]
MRPLVTILAVLASIAFAGNAGAEDLVVGVAAPLSGPTGAPRPAGRSIGSGHAAMTSAMPLPGS